MGEQNLIKIAKLLSENILILSDALKGWPDIVQRRIIIQNKQECLLLYIDGLTDIDLLQRDILQPLLKVTEPFGSINDIEKSLPVAGISNQWDINSVIVEIVMGKVIILADGLEASISLDIKKFEQRGIEEPSTEKNVRGSHEGFVESIGINISILRRKVRNPKLKFHALTLGEVTNQKVVIAYIEDIANPKILSTLIEKITNINQDGLLDIGYIEQLILDFPSSPFPQYQTTERPDKAVASLLEGKFLVVLDGTPVTLIAPTNFFSFFQALDDFSTHWILGSFTRMIRITAGLLAIFLPALYIAVVSYHYYMIPLNLLIPLAESRTKVPFPPIIEALIMEAILELIREAAIRLPTYIGTSLGVVGGLIIGQAAVDAGIVSTLMIIIVAVTAISTFLIPNYDMGLAIRISRFIVMIFASVFGMIGIVISAGLLLAHLLDLKSLGQPYLQPFIPLKVDDIKDTIYRFPLKFQKKRPNIANPNDKLRGTENE
jgi:hypothetical protein